MTNDVPVGEHRLEVIDSGSGERLYSAMRDQAQRGQDFRRRVRMMWLRHDLISPPVAEIGSAPEVAAEPGVPQLIDLRKSAVPVKPSGVLPAPRREGSA